MNAYRRFTFATALLVVVLGVLPISQANSTAPAALVATCEMRLRVELTPDVPDPRAARFVGSLVGDHPDYWLTLQGQDLDNGSVIALDLTGPGPEARCRQVVNSVRKNAGVVWVEVLPDSPSTTSMESTARPVRSTQLSRVQPVGTVHAGPDGDWIVEPLNGVSYVQQASDRYQCDIWAVDQTGFDPTKDDGGVPLQAVPAKRADYLRAEATCFEARGYLMR